MGEVLDTAAVFDKARLSLPWTLFKLAEQLSNSHQEVMKMNVMATHGI